MASQSFSDLGVRADLIPGLAELGIVRPTEVQAKVIPMLLANGGDLVVQAQTGTGKTAAFGLPLLAGLDAGNAAVQALVLAPTRELAKQIGKQLFRYTKFAEERVFINVAAGGEDIDRQAASLARPTQVVVATPGRLLDLIKRKALVLDGVRLLVLDEADEMLSMGFKKELHQVIKLTAARRGTWLFSATIPDAVHTLVKDCMAPQPRVLRIDQSHVVNRNIHHRFIVCNRDEKADRIAEILGNQGPQRGVIFCRTKGGAIQLGKTLEARGYPVAVIQGDLAQKDRDSILRSFRKQRFQFLVATDVAARGIDVEGLGFVIHHQLPEQTEYYTHRSGRTARAGKKGVSIALVEPRERARIAALEKELGVSFREAH